MAKVTGIGGVFFKSKADCVALAAWYRRHLGMALDDFGGAILKRRAELLTPSSLSSAARPR